MKLNNVIVQVERENATRPSRTGSLRAGNPFERTQKPQSRKRQNDSGGSKDTMAPPTSKGQNSRPTRHTPKGSFEGSMPISSLISDTTARPRTSPRTPESRPTTARNETPTPTSRNAIPPAATDSQRSTTPRHTRELSTGAVSEPPEGDDTIFYKSIGKCYVHRMMKGKAMSYQSTERLPRILFELR